MSIRTSRTNRRSRRRGSAVMDAALVFPPLIWLTMGSIDFGYFFYVKHTLQGAAREGARASITPGATNTDVTTAVNQVMNAAGFIPAKYTVAIRNTGDTADVNVATTTAGTGILVKVSAVWGTVGTNACPIRVIGSTKNVVGQTVMRKEG